MNSTQAIRQRIPGIDTLRGIIMLIMTLDHSRDFLHFQGPEYSPTNMETTTVILFLTRWITHFCAPAFVLLSGVSASLAGLKRTSKELTGFLIKRGLWLILTDMLVISLIFTLNPRYHVFVLEVLWAIGCGMVVLAGLLRVHAPVAVIGALGVLLVFGHNSLDYAQLPDKGIWGSLLSLFLTGRGAVIPLGGDRIIVLLYSALPWCGALLIGYALGTLYRPGFDAGRRKAVLLNLGCTLIVLFVGIRMLNGYGDPGHWSGQRNTAHTLLSFLNATKQPPSLVFMCMTLAPVLVLLALLENRQNRVFDFCAVYGNVPFFYFIAHLTLLRVMNLLLIVASGLGMKSDGNPIVWQAAGFGFPLWAVYLYWLFVIAALYLPCRWYGRYKRTHGQWWLSYI